MDTTKEAERSLAAFNVAVIKNRGLSSSNPYKLVSSGLLSLVTPTNPSTNFNPSDPFWAFLLGLSLVRGTSGGAP